MNDENDYTKINNLIKQKMEKKQTNTTSQSHPQNHAKASTSSDSNWVQLPSTVSPVRVQKPRFKVKKHQREWLDRDFTKIFKESREKKYINNSSNETPSLPRTSSIPSTQSSTQQRQRKKVSPRKNHPERQSNRVLHLKKKANSKNKDVYQPKNTLHSATFLRDFEEESKWKPPMPTATKKERSYLSPVLRSDIGHQALVFQNSRKQDRLRHAWIDKAVHTRNEKHREQRNMTKQAIQNVVHNLKVTENMLFSKVLIPRVDEEMLHKACSVANEKVQSCLRHCNNQQNIMSKAMLSRVKHQLQQSYQLAETAANDAAQKLTESQQRYKTIQAHTVKRFTEFVQTTKIKLQKNKANFGSANADGSRNISRVCANG